MLHTKIKELMSLAVANKASDLHLSIGFLPKLRVNGELVDITNAAIESETQMEEMIFSLLSDDQKKRLLMEKEIDLSVAIEQARFRVNVYFSMGKVAATLRIISSEIPTMDQLGIPTIIRSLCNVKQGFVLLTGPTGQGKSTTLASLLNEINYKRSAHIVTIEDPVEYILKPAKSLISQRELGGDTLSFAGALKSALRQDPNVVLVGEMRDLETIGAALTTAETGHLVFSTLHTNSAAQSIDRVVDVFPEGAKEQVRIQLASVITAVVSQRLVPGINGGRIAAFEVMMASAAIRNAIRESKSHMIDNIITTSGDLGMFSLETSLVTLIREGKITEETAMNYALRPSEISSKLRNKS